MGQLNAEKTGKVNLQIMKVYINEISYFDLLLCYTPMLPKIFHSDCSYHMTGLVQLTILNS